MIVVTIFCAVRTYRDFANGNMSWAIISLIVTIAAIVAICLPIPTHAIKVDIPR